MQQVEFEGDQHQRSILYAKLLQPSDTTPSLINWLTKTGIAKTPEMANKILVVVMVFSFALTGWTAWRSFGDSASRTALNPQDQVNLPTSNTRLR